MHEAHEEVVVKIDNGKRILAQRDKLTALNELVQCLNFAISNEEYFRYNEKPHYSLIKTIQNLITDIDEELADITARISLGY